VASVRLTAPPPLDLELQRYTSADGVRLMRDEMLLGTARRSELVLDAPVAPSFAEAEQASRGYVGHTQHPFPTCFVCGTEREPGDGLRIFPGPVDGREIIAAPWIPARQLSADGGAVDPIYIWSALDCTGAFAVLPDAPDRTIVLGELTVRIDGSVMAGRPHVTVGWSLGAEGRKRYAGSAIYTEAGAPVALGRATWIDVPLAAFAG
jgi:hypothetical protein